MNLFYFNYVWRRHRRDVTSTTSLSSSVLDDTNSFMKLPKRNRVRLLEKRNLSLQKPSEVLQWTHLQFISFAIAPDVLLIVVLLKNGVGGAIANESTVNLLMSKREAHQICSAL